ncbi:hypothetical protein [Carboxylicivirga marina]|uniref:hypothetical protein n=1 Tax=Carboxylicivirga marina TaxID=2800988 RepID=UPI002599FFC4|nr:hypothetical protein [uncultured Carboxylicivirga sp.]
MKLTVKNYKQATKKIDFKKLPEPAQEAHKEFDAFADFYNEDKDIKDMLDNHFRIVEPYLNENKLRFPELDDRHPLNILDKESGQYKEALKEYRESKKKKPTSRKPASKPNTTKRKTAAPKTTKSKSSKQAQRKPIEVDLMPLEIKVIKRYLNFHNKRVSERQVSLLYKVIQKAATEKTIRKTSKYASEIKSIGNDLIKTYKEMNGTCKFVVPDSLYGKLKDIVDDYGVTPAVALIKRFINLYGNITKAKAQRLLTTVTNSLKNGKVKKTEKEYDQVKKVQKHLHDYLESDKLLVTNVQLKGLQGIAKVGK